EAAASAAAADPRHIFRHVRLLICRRIIFGPGRTAVLQESDPVQTGLGIIALFALAAALVRGIAIAVGLIGLAGRTLLALLRRSGLAFFAAVAPALIIALAEATHGLDHAEVMVGILPVGFRQDSVARRGGLAGQRLVF